MMRRAFAPMACAPIRGKVMHAMPYITTDNHLVTLINVFIVEPANQPHLVDLLVEATDDVMKELPGFVSASIHASEDGTRVTNYTQWRNREDFEAMLKNPAAQEHMRSISEIAESDSHLYEVVEAIEVGTQEGGRSARSTKRQRLIT